MWRTKTSQYPGVLNTKNLYALCSQQAVKTDKTTDRLTDASKYTGSHKERFDKDGKGKGLEGRVDKADTSGYVGNYKNAGTYDSKH